jgi:hypothetical protein
MTNNVQIRELSADEINGVSGGLGPFGLMVAGWAVGKVLDAVVANPNGTIPTPKGAVQKAADAVIQSGGRPK